MRLEKHPGRTPCSIQTPTVDGSTNVQLHRRIGTKNDNIPFHLRCSKCATILRLFWLPGQRTCSIVCSSWCLQPCFRFLNCLRFFLCEHAFALPSWNHTGHCLPVLHLFLSCLSHQKTTLAYYPGVAGCSLVRSSPVSPFHDK